MAAAKKVTVILAGSAAGAVKAFEEAAVAADASAKGMGAAFDSGTTRVGNAFQRLGKTMGSWGLPFSESLTKMGDKMAEAETKSGKLIGTMQAVGKVSAVVGLAGFAVVGAESVKMASKFQQSMQLLVTAGGESQSALKQVSDGVLKISGQTGTSTEQLAEGMYTVEKAGYRAGDGLNVLKMAAEGAKAENVDLATMTNAVTSIMTSYHAKASDAATITNELVAASGAAKTTMSEFAGSLSTVLPIASAAGISFAQVGGAIATLTQHGTSADEATQELANTIRSLQAPNQVAMNEMQQLGLNVNDLTTHLGQRGLTGTLSIVIDAIGKKMGPAGTIMLNSFKESQSASQDLQIELGKMSPKLADLSRQYLAGSLGAKAYKNDIKALGAEGYSQGSQFMALADKAKGFNDLLKSGSPAAQTFTAALKEVMGGSTGLNTALMLTGENMAGFQSRVNEIGDAAKKGGANVSTWAQTQKNLAVQMDQLKDTVEALGVRLGMALIPKLEDAAHATAAVISWFEKHATVAKVLAGVIGGVLAMSLAAWVAHLVIGSAKAVGSFAKMIAQGAVWVAKQSAQFTVWVAKQVASTAESAALWAMYTGEWLARQATAMGTWVAEQATQMASWVAQTAAQLARSTAAGAVWIAEHAVQAAMFIAQNVAMAASATAAFVAENAATLGIAAAVAALIAAVVYAATHWRQVWGDIKKVASDAWHFIYDGIGKYLLVFLGPAGAIALGAIELAKHWDTVWHGIQATLQAVWSVIKPILDGIKTAVNDTVGAVGKVASIASSVGKGAGGVVGGLLSHLPHLAEGGVVNQPTLALLGEGGEREYVVPQSKLAGLAPAGATAPLGSGFGGRGAGGVSIVYNPTVTLNGTGVGRPVTDQDVHRMLRDHTDELVQMLSARGF